MIFFLLKIHNNKNIRQHKNYYQTKVRASNRNVHYKKKYRFRSVNLPVVVYSKSSFNSRQKRNTSSFVILSATRPPIYCPLFMFFFLLDHCVVRLCVYIYENRFLVMILFIYYKYIKSI